MRNYNYLAVDYQYDFVGAEGKEKVIGDSPAFIKNELIPFMKEHNLLASEIVSDYRLPRGKSIHESCVPGEKGYESMLPDVLRKGNQHIKCMHNPIWTRKGIGNPDVVPGEVYQDPVKFNQWVQYHFPDKAIPIIVFGETMECCILSVAQELYFRGYDINILYEATDPMPERQQFKNVLYQQSTLAIYTELIHFEDLLSNYKELSQ